MPSKLVQINVKALLNTEKSNAQVQADVSKMLADAFTTPGVHGEIIRAVASVTTVEQNRRMPGQARPEDN